MRDATRIGALVPDQGDDIAGMVDARPRIQVKHYNPRDVQGCGCRLVIDGLGGPVVEMPDEELGRGE